MWRDWNSQIVTAGVQIGTITLENCWQYQLKRNIHNPYDPAIPLLYVRETSAYVHQRNYTRMFREALLKWPNIENNPENHQQNGIN